MSRQVVDLQTLLQQLLSEHRKLLAQLESQHAAMKKFDMNALAEVRNELESTRLRINGLDVKRRNLLRQIAAGLKMAEEPTLVQLAQHFPQMAPGLLALRSDLKTVLQKIAERSQISSKLTGAVLGHLNLVMRLLAGAVERAGLYTRRGVPRLASRIGVMEAVG